MHFCAQIKILETELLLSMVHVESRHHPAQKQTAVNSFVHRAFTIADKEHLQTELNHLKLALQKNGHDKKDIPK